ncbi:MAG TPA: O-antigen ligase family protein [Acidimicrobiales bacterium]|jgi:hypothetical protein
MTAPVATEPRGAELARLRELLLVILVATIPLAMGVVVWSAPGGAGDFNRRVSISPLDVALALLLAVAIADRRPIGSWRERSWLARIAVALGAVLVIALAVHPSPKGFDLAFRIVAGLAVIDAFVRVSRRGRERVLAAIVVAGVVESLIGMAQAAHGGAIGAGPLEYKGFFYTFGSSTAGHAGFDHPYHLAFFLLVVIGAALVGARGATKPAPWIIGAGVCGAGLSITYSRAALLSLLLFGVLMLVARGPHARRHVLRLMAAAVAIGFVVGALSFGDGWHAKGAQTAGANADSSRRVRAQEALRLIEKQPAVGVGPGRYTIALESVRHSELLPAHNVVLQEAAEGGILAGVLSGLLLLALTVHAWRSGLETTAVFALPVLFFVLDAYPYVFPSGLAASAVWLGVLLTTPSQLADVDVPA